MKYTFACVMQNSSTFMRYKNELQKIFIEQRELINQLFFVGNSLNY